MQDSSPAEAPTAAIHGHGEAILMIEDDRAIRELMVAVFGRFNYRPLVAETVEEALDLWKAHQLDIHAVVSDCDLGHDRTGLSLLHEFAAARPGLVLILASGSLTAPLVHELERTTTIKCLPKPFGCVELLELLRASLDARTQSPLTPDQSPKP